MSGEKDYLSEGEWQSAMESAENRLIKLSGIPLIDLRKDFVTIEMDGNPFRVRTFEIGEKSKETLVITHGYTASALTYYTMLKQLSETYRLVLFDNGSWGLNTRLKECEAVNSPKASETWLIDWMQKVFEKLDLPNQYYLAGMSLGGYLMSLYASVAPAKVKALFLLTPLGTEPYNHATYDPYKLNFPFTLKPATRKQINEGLTQEKEKIHQLEFLRDAPLSVIR